MGRLQLPPIRINCRKSIKNLRDCTVSVVYNCLWKVTLQSLCCLFFLQKSKALVDLFPVPSFLLKILATESKGVFYQLTLTVLSPQKLLDKHMSEEPCSFAMKHHGKCFHIPHSPGVRLSGFFFRGTFMSFIIQVL